jgi:hypothetical protein
VARFVEPVSAARQFHYAANKWLEPGRLAGEQQKGPAGDSHPDGPNGRPR